MLPWQKRASKNFGFGRAATVSNMKILNFSFSNHLGIVFFSNFPVSGFSFSTYLHYKGKFEPHVSSLKKGAHIIVAFVKGQFRRKRVLDSVV